MKIQQTTIGTVAKKFASVVCLMSITLGLALGAQAETQEPVEYRAPVYKTPGDPTSGIVSWETRSTNVYKVVESAAEQVTWNAGWYVVTNMGVQLSKGANCAGAVNLVLADGCALYVKGQSNYAGITVSGEGNSFAIYGQSAGTGYLQAEGGYRGAGIGGDKSSAGRNITINGGNISVSGGTQAAGIGGGYQGQGTNITINGGTVDASGASSDVPGIGNGKNASSSAANIYVNPILTLKAGMYSPPETPIANSGADLANDLKDYRFVKVEEQKVPPTPIPFKVETPAHATVAVYTNEVAEAYKVDEGDTVWSNGTAYVVYTIDDESGDWYFTSGKVVTNTLDTSVNPAVDANAPASFVPVCRVVADSGDGATTYYGTVASMAAALKDTDQIYFLRSAEIDGVTVDKWVCFHLNGQFVTNKSLKVHSHFYVDNKVPGQGGLVNIGTVEVKGELDMNTLAWGEGGLLQSPDGSGKFVISAGGRVDMKNGYSPNWMEANAPDCFSGSATGAKVDIGGVVYTKTDSGIWATDNAVASTKVASTGTYGQGTIYYDETFTDLQKAIDSVVPDGTVTMLMRADTSSISVTNDYACTLELNGKSVMANSGSLTVRSPLTICDDSDSQGTICIAKRIVAYTNLTIKSGTFCVMDGMLYPGINAIDVKDGAIVYISGGTFEYAKPNEPNIAAGYVCYQTAKATWQVAQGVTLSNVSVAGTSNKVAVAGFAFGAEKGEYIVPAGKEIKVTYFTTDDYMFGTGGLEKTVTLDALSGDYAMTAEEKPTVVSRWDDERTVALDTRTRIVVAEPSEVLPLAYSTNAWGAYPEANWTRIYTNEFGKGQFFLSKREDGYAEWLPQAGAYGKYDFVQKWAYQVGTLQDVVYGSTNATIYYTTYFPLSWATPVGGTIAVTNAGAAVASGDQVLGYSLLNLVAKTTYTNAERYEFTGWSATQGGTAWTNIAEATATIEMPNAAVELVGGFQWKSNYTENVSVTGADVWEVHEGETYSGGVTISNGTFSSRCPVTVSGTIDAQSGATNVWDFTNHGQPCFNMGCLNYRDATTAWKIAFDSTLTNGTYVIANVMSLGLGKFLISNGTDEKFCEYNAKDYTYVGTKRFKVKRDSYHDRMTLLVEDGSFTITYDANGGAWSDGATNRDVLAYVITGYEFPAENPRRPGYAFEGWFRSGTNGAERVTELNTEVSPIDPYADHALYAHWKNGTAFEESQYTVVEGRAVKVYVLGGSPSNAVQATLSFVKGTGSYTAAYMNGKEVTLPLRLNWAKGEYSAKEILFQTEEDEDSKYDRTFTLQLSSPVGEEVLAAQDVCTVTLLDAQGYHKQYSYVRALAYPANAGTVTGAGKLTSKTTERVLQVEDAGIGTFKGWYAAKEDDPNVPDLNHRLTKKAKYTADEPGTYFAYFADVQAVSAVIAPDASEGNGVDFDAETETYLGTVGVKFRLPCACTEDGTLKVTGRPDGLSWKNGELVGVPTEAGTYKVKFTATNDAGAHVIRYVFKIAEMPKQAIGTWEGVVRDSFEPGIGSITFTASSVGDLSAKVVTQFAGTQTFEDEGYDKIDDDTYEVNLVSNGGEILTATLYLTAGWGEPQLEGYYDVSQSEFWSEYPESGDFQIIRNPYDKETGDPEARQRLAEYVGTYEETLYRDGRDKGDVSFKVKSNGKVVIKAAFSSKEFSGTVAGGIKVSEDGSGWIETALRGDRCIWSADADLDSANRTATGAARYINKGGNEYDYTIGEGEPQ